MPVLQQPLHQRRADQSTGTGYEHAQRPRVASALRCALISGTCASLSSSALISWFSHRRVSAVPAGTNATSHWLWGPRAQRRNGWSLRHTLAGYLIHHASSLFWAAGYEWLRRGRHAPCVGTLSGAAGIAALAYVVDYTVVPARLTPGFERRLPPRDLYVIYAGFALGLALPWLLSTQAPRHVGNAHRKRP